MFSFLCPPWGFQGYWEGWPPQPHWCINVTDTLLVAISQRKGPDCLSGTSHFNRGLAKCEWPLGWQHNGHPLPHQPHKHPVFITCLSWVQGVNSRANTPVETWKGSKGKQSYTYVIKENATMSFTWAFQRTTFHETVSSSPSSDPWLPSETLEPRRIPSISQSRSVRFRVRRMLRHPAESCLFQPQAVYFTDHSPMDIHLQGTICAS